VLLLAFPSLLAISTLLGHNGLALLPLFLAWAVTGLHLWREGPMSAPQRSGTGRLGVGKGLETTR
jgi:hypothetical protein